MFRATRQALQAGITESPQQWHVRGGMGGTKTSISTWKDRGLDGLSLEQALNLRDSIRAVMGEAHRGLATLEAIIEKAACLNRKWTDEEFQDGEAGNEARVLELEQAFAKVYNKEGSLDDTVTLGMALDLVGAYLKNYKVAKAAAIMDEALPRCRRRGSVWLIKGLNHASTVRMKQQRFAEALIMLRELESLFTYDPQDAVELYDMLYRNMGMVLQALNKSEEALPYYMKCAAIKGVATWWDRWDVGYCMANLAFKHNDFDLLRKASATIAEAVPLHLSAEPGQFVMNAKIRQALGDCYLALATIQRSASEATAQVASTIAQFESNSNAVAVLAEEAIPVLPSSEYLARAEEHYIEAHQLFTEHCGYTNDLSGWCAAAAALTMVQRKKHREALTYLAHAVYVYSRSDIPKLAQLLSNLELVMQCHNSEQDPALLVPFMPHLDNLLARLDSPLLKADAGDLSKIKRTAALILASSDVEQYRDKGLDLLVKHM
ncbi:hypothetical protein DIPPA_33632 [Diplonema papillatum]|nr:hypothetical protein DIPPA_33632 [Diplonema papillatum]